jgi:hypothetical protein
LKDLARFLNLGSVRTVTRLLAAGELPIRERPRMGRVRRFYGADLRALLHGERPGAARRFFGRAKGQHADTLAPTSPGHKSNRWTPTDGTS